MKIVFGIIWLILFVIVYCFISKIYKSMFNVVYFGFGAYFKEKFIIFVVSLFISFIPIYIVMNLLGLSF